MDSTPYLKIKEKCEKVFKGKYGIYDEDVIYDTMASIILQFRKNQNEIKNLNAWISGAIHHHYCSYVSRKVKERNTFQYDYMIQTKDNDSVDFAENKIDAAIVMKEIDQLEYPYNEILKLRLIQGFSHKEISEELSINESTVRKYYSRSLKKIFNILRPLSQILMFTHLIEIHI